MVYCSRKCQIFSSTICALLWAAAFIVAMLVPYIILQAQNEGVKKLVVIDRDTWTQKQWDNYTVSTLNMSYYLWNATNLDAVMKDTTGATFIKWQEVGPFNISKISHMETLSGESASSGSPYIRYRKLTTYKIRDEATKQLLSKPIVGINTLWVGALSRAAQSLYAGSIQSAQGPTQDQKVAAIRANLYQQAFNKESLFYGALTQGWLSGAAVQFTALNASGYTPESALIPAFRILSIGSYLGGAVRAFGVDPGVRSYLQLGPTADEITTFTALKQAWGAGQSNRTLTIALRSTDPAVQIFQDFELTAKINTSNIERAWNRADNGVTAVALVTVPGLRNWGVALQCVALGGLFSTARCNPQQTQAYQLIARVYGTVDFITIVAWLVDLPKSPLLPDSVNLLDTSNTIKPDWRRNYKQINNNTYAYIATTPAERFQQIIVSGFQQGLTQGHTQLAGAGAAVFAEYGFDLSSYPFAPPAISVIDGSTVEEQMKVASNQIQSFYDLALLQYATGWIVGSALSGNTTSDPFGPLRGKSVSQSDALGASAGFGGQVNIENEPIEFSQAVQLVDPTIPIKDTRLTVKQAKALLEFIQGTAKLSETIVSATIVTPAIIGFTLVSDVAIRVSQGTLVAIYTDAMATNNTDLAKLLAPYLQLRTSAVFEGIEKLPVPLRANPSFTLPGIWSRAISEVNKTAGASFLPAVRTFIMYSGYINETSGAGIRPFVAYFHSYFRRLQGGVGPIEALYSIPGASSTASSVQNEVYNPVFGVSRRTNGLFIQRTAFEFLFGGRSHLPNTELNPILSPTTSYLDENYREYDGGAIRDGAIPTPGANPIMLSAVYNIPYERDTLDEAKRRNAIVFQGQETAINTGRMDIDAVGKYHVYNGMTRYNTICQYNNPGRVPEIKADASFRLPGEILRSACVQDGPADYSIYDNGFYEEVGDRVNDPGQFQPFREGDSKLLPVIGTFISEVARTVAFNYTGIVNIKGINLRRYQLDSKYLFRNDAPNNPYKNSDYRQIEKQGFYPETPDGMVSGWYLLGAPIYVSKPHFYQVSPQVTSAFAPGSFNPQTPLHETYLDVDALSGKTLHARKRLQANVYVSGDTIDASPHLEPIFKSGDKFFPCYWAQEAGTITDEDADSFKTNIYKARDIGRIVQIVVGVFSAIFFVICVAFVVRSCTKTPDATTTDK